MPSYILIGLYLKLICFYAYAQSPPGHYERLLNDIFNGYDKRVRPFSNTNKPVAISETILGCILIQIEETRQVASYVITRKQNWTDPRFKWEPSEYGGIQNILVPSEDIWRADVFNYNNKEFENLLPEAKDWSNIHFDGKVASIIPQYMEATCKILVHRFPFDTQYCMVSFTSNMLGDALAFATIPVDYKPNKFRGNSEWTIENVTITTHRELEPGVWGEKGDVFSYIIQIKRCPTYYITVILVPTFFITAVSIVGVFSPGTDHEPGDVANLGLAALLALMVLLGIISERLPKSQEMSLLGFHILVILIFFVICVILEMASLYYFQKMSTSGKRPPQWLYKAALVGMLPWEKKKKRRDSNVSYYSLSAFKNTISVSAISPTLSNGSDIKISLENGQGSKDVLENWLQMTNKLFGKYFIKTIFAKSERDYKLKYIIGDLKSKHDEKQRLMEKEWDMIEARLDFILIAVFEAINLLNLFSLIWYAALPSPDMKYWLE